MIVVDGRTDREKLLELLGATEGSHLEFKEHLDLNDPAHCLNFVKDAVAIANTPKGGYLLVGVTNDGALALALGSIEDRSRFDGARLGDLVRKYVESEIQIISQIHEIDGHEVVVIYLPHHRDGLPAPMSKIGQHGRDSVVFRPGDLFVREGPQNTPVRHAHWGTILAIHDERIRSEARAAAEDLIERLASALGENQGGILPLTRNLGKDTFAAAVRAHLEAGSDIPFRQFLTEARTAAATDLDRLGALDEMTIIAAQAMYFERTETFSLAVDALYEAYERLESEGAGTQILVIDRIYALGSLAVRTGRWAELRSLVLRPYPRPRPLEYVYSSWIRHGQVEASRMGLFPDGSGMMISAARQLATTNAAVRPDFPADLTTGDRNPAAEDLLDSLCQFDLLYCFVVAVGGQHDGGAYPAASWFEGRRSAPILTTLLDPDARQLLFPDVADDVVSTSVKAVLQRATQEAAKHGIYWSSASHSAQLNRTRPQVEIG